MTFGNLDIEKFEERKKEFQALKNSKLAYVAHKHIGDNFSAFDLWNHLREEIDELNNEVNTHVLPTKKTIEEIVDVSNMLDFLYFKLTICDKAVPQRTELGTGGR